jgi:hypothetical protein
MRVSCSRAHPELAGDRSLGAALALREPMDLGPVLHLMLGPDLPVPVARPQQQPTVVNEVRRLDRSV